MHYNTEVFLSIVAFGGIAKFLSLRYPSPGKKAVTAGALLIAAFFFGLTTPQESTRTAEYMAIAYAVVDLAGEYFGMKVDKYLVRRQVRGFINGRSIQANRKKGQRLR